MFGIDDIAGAGLIGAGLNVASTLFTNNQNRDNATRQMDFQSNMSNTAHTREVQDLKNAGLNPILSANAGASTGNGAMPNAQAPSIDMPSIIAAKQNQTALDQKQQSINIDKANSAAGIAKSLSDAELNKARALTEKSGAFGRYFGSDAYNYFSNPQSTFRKGMKLKGEEMNRNPQFNQSPIQFGGMK